MGRGNLSREMMYLTMIEPKNCHLPPCSFIKEATERFQKEVSESEYLNCLKEYHPRIYRDFLYSEAIRREGLRNPTLTMKTSDIPISNRVKKALWYGCIDDVGELIQYSEQELRLFPGIGDKALASIVDFLNSAGLYLRENDEPRGCFLCTAMKD